MSRQLYKQNSLEFVSSRVIPDQGWLIFLLVPVFCSFCLSSCRETTRKVDTTVHIHTMDDTLLNFNRQVVVEESQEIDDFIQRYHWNMHMTQTGLRWMIYKNGKGNIVRKGDVACIKYSISLINGDVVCHADSSKLFEFEVGKAEVPNGLDEGILFLKRGDHAKLILPSHLAFGLLGDMDKIRNRAILVYDVELCQIKPLRREGH